MQFNELNLISPLLTAVGKAGYVSPSPIQEKTIPLLLAGRDVLGCAQTGTGKTAAFALPILQLLSQRQPREDRRRPIRALILTPTRELAIQIFENFEQYGGGLPLKTAVIFGGVNQNPQVAKLKSGVDILVATPGRLNDLIGQGHIRLDHLDIFVLDEADRMLDMGFIHDVRKVIALLPEKRQTLLFSATMPKEVEELALGLLRDPATVKISPVMKTVDKITQSVYFVTKDDKPDMLIWLLHERAINTALVFTRTKHGADQVVRKLLKAGMKAMAIHGNKSQNARQEALGQFKAGHLRVLVATDIAARGIDVAELPFVINYNVPDTPEAYIHRIGRTGRAGLDGEAITLCCSDELRDWRDIERNTKQSVPVGECPWSVVDMQPTQAPAPGSQRRSNQPYEPRNHGDGNRGGNRNVRGNTRPAENTPRPPRTDKTRADKPRADKPHTEERPETKPARTPRPQTHPSHNETHNEPVNERRPAPRGDRRSEPRHSSYTPTYSPYGASRPIRPFQPRGSFAQPKAEDFPPPATFATETKNEPEQTTAEGAKKRRHRGGRGHQKPTGEK